MTEILINLLHIWLCFGVIPSFWMYKSGYKKEGIVWSYIWLLSWILYLGIEGYLYVSNCGS